MRMVSDDADGPLIVILKDSVCLYHYYAVLQWQPLNATVRFYELSSN